MDEMMVLANRLNHYKTTNPDIGLDHFEIGRHTYCHLMVQHMGKYHKFEIRSIRVAYDYSVIELGAVNWTMAAGTCTLSIKPETVGLFKILEDHPTMRVLYE